MLALVEGRRVQLLNLYSKLRERETMPSCGSLQQPLVTSAHHTDRRRHSLSPAVRTRVDMSPHQLRLRREREKKEGEREVV